MSLEIIGDRGNWNRIDSNLVDKLNKESIVENKSSTKKPNSSTPKIKPFILKKPNSAQDYWTIPGVIDGGFTRDVDVKKTLLEGGNTNTQDGWIEYRKIAEKQGQFYTPSFPLFYNILKQAFYLKDESAYKKQIEEMRTTLQDLSRKNWLMTLTRIKYMPNGNDEVDHNYGLKDNYGQSLNFIGQDGEIPAGSSSNVYISLLGTSDSEDKIKDVFRWLNNTSTYIWRLNSKPSSIKERVAGFCADSDRALLCCDGDRTGSNSSLGVRVASEASGGAN